MTVATANRTYFWMECGAKTYILKVDFSTDVPVGFLVFHFKL